MIENPFRASDSPFRLETSIVAASKCLDADIGPIRTTIKVKQAAIAKPEASCSRCATLMLLHDIA